MNAEHIAEVIEFEPRVQATYQEVDQSGLWKIADQLVAPLWLWTSRHVDDWGRDNDLTNLVWNLSKVRWDVSIGGIDRVGDGGGLIVVNDRRLSHAPVWAALALGAALDRPVRFAGRPGVPVVGPLFQRIGALLAVRDDVEGALRSEQLVVVGAQPSIADRRCGNIDPAMAEVALRVGAPVYPVATASSAFGRGARIDIAAPLSRPKRRGLLGSIELAERARRRIDEVLRDFGGQSEPHAADVISVGLRGRR